MKYEEPMMDIIFFDEKELCLTALSGESNGSGEEFDWSSGEWQL